LLGRKASKRSKSGPSRGGGKQIFQRGRRKGRTPLKRGGLPGGSWNLQGGSAWLPDGTRRKSQRNEKKFLFRRRPAFGNTIKQRWGDRDLNTRTTESREKTTMFVRNPKFEKRGAGASGERKTQGDRRAQKQKRRKRSRSKEVKLHLRHSNQSCVRKKKRSTQKVGGRPARRRGGEGVLAKTREDRVTAQGGQKV